MKLQPCKGFMIPGLCFKENYCIWVLKWDTTPTQHNKITEIWIFYPDGKRVCYIDPVEEIPFFKKYHSFDEVKGAEIKLSETKKNINITVYNNKSKIMEIKITTGFSLKYSVINLLLKNNKDNKIGDKGKTETGKIYNNVSDKIKKISKTEIILEDQCLSKLIKPDKEIEVGDGKASKDPILSYCSLYLED